MVGFQDHSVNLTLTKRIDIEYTVNMTSSVYSARTPREFKQRSEENGGLELLAHLTGKELNSSASRWGLRHLLGFRLLTLPEHPFLDIFKEEHENCPRCYPERPCWQEINHHWTAVLTSTCPLDYLSCTDSELLQLPGGPFWVALARASRAEGVPKRKDYPQRERRPPQRDGYVNSTDAIVDSSSQSGPSSSEFEVAHDDVDEDEHDARRSKPEEVTAHLLLCFLQFGLNLCLSQDPTASYEVQPRVRRRKCTTSVAGKYEISAEDDGGICMMYHEGHIWNMKHPSLALLEAKKAFKYMHFNEKSRNPKPVVSNATLAQYLGEALVSWRSSGEFMHQE